MFYRYEKLLDERLAAFRKKLEDKQFGAALISKRENYMYLSGFTGTSAVLLITADKAFLLTDFRYVHQARQQSPHFEIIRYQGDVIAEVNELIINNKVGVLGFEERYVTYDMYSRLRKKLKTESFLPMDGIVEDMRVIKDIVELEKIRKAVQIADEAFKHILRFIKPGVREIEIAAEIEYFMKKQGASNASFETIVASGERSSMPHGVASYKKLEYGDTVTMDYGAVYGGYCSDMTRTVFIGTVDEEMKKIYGVVLDAQLKALEVAAAGLSGKYIDGTARECISKAGYGEFFGHGLGHGVGLEIHEEPRFAPSANYEIKSGMVVTVEPGIYISGLGGVRIEDMIVVKDDMSEILTASPKEMIVV